MVNGDWHTIAFFSRRLQPTEMKYSTFGRELLATYLTIRHLYDFFVLTDHKPLTYALATVQVRIGTDRRPTKVPQPRHSHRDTLGNWVS